MYTTDKEIFQTHCEIEFIIELYNSGFFYMLLLAALVLEREYIVVIAVCKVYIYA